MAAPTWVGAATGGVNANANTTITYPAGTTTNDLLILFIEAACYANGTLTWTTPTGWAELATVTSGGAAPIDHKIYIRWSAGESDVTVSLNVGTSRVTTAALHVWRGTDMTSPIDAYALTYDTAANSTSQTHPSITTTVADTVVSRFFSGAYNSASTCTVTQSGGSQTERTDHSITYSSNNKLVEASSTESFASAGATGTRTFTSTITNGANGLGIVAVRGPQPQNYTGDASTTSTATLTATGTRGTSSDASTTGTATLSAAGTRGANSDSSTTATATLTAAGIRGAFVGASTTSTASLTAEGTRATGGSASATGTATLTADGSRAATSGSSATGTATLSAAGSVAALGSSLTTATATLSGSGSVATSGGASLTATAALTADGEVGIPPGSASTVGTATLTADGSTGARGSATTTGTATLTANGTVGLSGSAAQTGTATLTATGSVGAKGSASTTATATLTGAGSIGTLGGAETTVATATLTAAGNVQPQADGYLLKRGQAPSMIVRGADGVAANAIYLGERLVWDGSRPVMVQIPTARATASMPAPVVVTGASVGLPPMYATASMPEPRPVVNALVAIPTATATASMPAPEPVVDAFVEIPVAAATAFMPDPGVLVTDTAIGQAVTMYATASMPAPNPVVDALVVVPPMTASASMPVPVPGIQTTTSIPPMTATAFMPAPTVAAGSTIAIPPALASGFMLAPSVSAGAKIIIPPMMGSAVMLAPTIATTISLSDTFNRTTGLGADWVTIGQAPVINTNRVQGGTTGASSATTAYAARHATPLTQANQEVTQWIVQPVGTQSYTNGSEAFCRSNAAGTERVSVRATISGTTHTLTIYSYQAGVATSRGSTTSYKFDLFGSPLRLAPTAVGIRAVGNVYTVILNDIPTTLTWTDSGNLVSQANRYWGFQVYTTESGAGAATYSNAIAHMDGKDYTGEAPAWKALSWMQPGYGNKQDGWGYYSASTTTFHNGVDVVGSAGRNIYAAADGVVVYTETGHVKGDPGYGNYVSLGHVGGIATDYAHMSTVLATVGQTVSMGDVIGLSGTTGNSTTAHLHFGVRRGAIPWLGASDPWIKDTQFPYQDPERFLTDNGVTLNWTVDPG